MKLTAKQIERTQKIADFDIEISKQDKLFCGIDEAGRGPLAGPVVVASCIMPLQKDKILYGVYDSKKLTETQRNELYDKIKETAVCYHIQEVDNTKIDEINILNATKLGMKLCIENLTHKPALALVDAVKNIDSVVEQMPIIKGDATSYSIACASILAKVYRDKLMTEISAEYPSYNFNKNKGYGTAEHIQALKQFGATKLHRKSFIKNFVENK